jgi:VIT1/CCC1 family predicted Fe2+/Mn2+ transporter
MEPTDITIEILKSIRDELHDGLGSVRGELHDGLNSVRGELTGVREDLAGVTERMDRLERRQTEADLRIATELVAIAGAVRETRDAYREERALRHRVDDHERRLSGRGKARRRVTRRAAPRAVHGRLHPPTSRLPVNLFRLPHS